MQGILRRSRLVLNFSDIKVSRHVRITTNVSLGDNIVTRHVRIFKNIDVNSLAVRRLRILAETDILSYSNVWITPYTFTLSDVLSNGKGSILNHDLKIKSVTNSGINIYPGFFYYNNIEYFAYGDDYNYTNLNSGETIYDANIFNNKYDVPITVTKDNITDRFIKIYNPSNSSNAYRKITDLSNYTESDNGLTDYAFEHNINQYQLIDSGENITFIFNPLNSGDTKNIVSSTSNITHKLPNPLDIPYKVEGFVTITDEEKLISNNSISIYYPMKQFKVGDDLHIIISIRTINGEPADNYPILIDNVQHITDVDGIISTTLSAKWKYAIKTDTPSVPSGYNTDSYNINLSFKLEVLYPSINHPL